MDITTLKAAQAEQKQQFDAMMRSQTDDIAKQIKDISIQAEKLNARSPTMVEKIKLDTYTLCKDHAVGSDHVSTARDGMQLVFDAVDSSAKKAEMEKGAEKVMEVGAPELGNVVRIWNEEGSIQFGDFSEEATGRSGVNFRIVNKKGTVDFTTSPASRSSWFSASSLLKLAIFGGMAYIYREELKILGRGVVAGARLAIERWEEKEDDRKRDRDIAAGIEELNDLTSLPDDDFHTLTNSTMPEPEEQGQNEWLFRGALGAELDGSVIEGEMWDRLQGEGGFTVRGEDVDLGVINKTMIPEELRKMSEDNERLAMWFEERKRVRESEKIAKEMEDDEL
jgi:hypothetical protein